MFWMKRYEIYTDHKKLTHITSNLDLKDIIGKNAYELFPDRIFQERFKIVKKSLDENHTIKFADERDGRFYENIFVPSHERQSVQIIIRDITERKQVEEELRKAYSQLKDTQQELIQLKTIAAMGEFAEGVAHEIRNPLANISAGSS